MRELKFRIPCKDDCGEVFMLYATMKDLAWGRFNVESPQYGRIREILGWEQFTGLKDKNGAEIYDGDILSCGDTFDVVEWSDADAMWMLTWGDDGLPLCEGIDNERSKVVGNIHENPELMGVK
jgi:hypothetical protein